jgi:hypothetical protein
MKNLLFVTALLCLFVSESAFPEMDVSTVKLISEEVKKSVNAGDFSVAHNIVNEHCGMNNYFELKNDKTVYERAELLHDIQLCAEMIRVDASAAALNNKDLNAKMAVEEMSAVSKKEMNTEMKNINSEVNFLGLNWGLGFGYTFSSDEAIDDAEIVDGIVKVKSNKKQQPRMILEFHRYLGCNNGAKDGTQGCGPFVAVAASNDKILQGVGMGFMYGFKAKKSDPEGFSIGIGAMLDGNVKDLADGFKENQAVPDGATSIRYKTESRWSALIFAVRTF